MSVEIATQKLAEYKTVINQDIALISRRIQKQTEEIYGEYSGEVIQAYLDVLSRGGKRLRGALTMHAYFMSGGDDERIAVRAATCIEMLHAYLLLVDDVADQSRLRRGSATAHIALEQYHREHHFKHDPIHFGKSQAINAALAGMHLAMLEIGRLSLDDSKKLEAMNLINEAMVTTTQGQINDIMNEVAPTVSEAATMQVLTWKTAYYTFVNPLEFGLTLAGKSMNDFPWLRDYAMHIGLSFQLTDDLIGIFGNSQETGKSNLDDLREGKITPLIVRALTHANSEQRQQLQNILGRQDITDADRDSAMQILEDTGARQYVQELAEREGERASAVLDTAQSTWGSDIPFLRGLVEYIRSKN